MSLVVRRKAKIHNQGNFSVPSNTTFRWNSRKDFNFLKHYHSSNKRFQIFEVSLNDSKNTYCLQILSITDLVNRNNLDELTKETQILMNFQHPNILKQVSSFQENENLYNLFEHFSEESLGSVVAKTKSLAVMNARIIIAQLLKALAYIHQKAFIHCNVKPTSILFDKDNRVKLSQFQFSKNIDYPKIRSSKNCLFQQNIDFLAPEIVNKSDLSHASDLWSVGCILYFMLKGEPPFHSSDNQHEIKRNITLLRYEIPKYFPPDAADLITKLLKTKPSDRLGYNDFESDYKSIQNHPFFNGFPWDNCETMTQLSFTPLNTNASSPSAGQTYNSVLSEREIKQLEFEFKTDLNLALHHCETIFCNGKFSNIDEFSLWVKGNFQSLRCTTSWTKPTLVVQCETCRIDKLACICLPCYLNGDHKGHKVSLVTSYKGFCDCGVCMSMKKEGFCRLHSSHAKKDIHLLNDVESFNFQKCFGVGLSIAHELAIYDPQEFHTLFKWMMGLAKLCLDIRYCLAKAFVDNFDLPQFFLDSAIISYKSSEIAYYLFTILVNEECFRNKMVEVAISCYPKLVWTQLRLASIPSNDVSTPPLFQVRTLSFFFEYVFSNSALIYAHQQHMNCTNTISESLPIIIDFGSSFNMNSYKKGGIESIVANFASIASIMSKIDDSCDDEFNSLLMKFTSEIIKLEGALPTPRQFNEKVNDPLEQHVVLNKLCHLFAFIASKITHKKTLNYKPVIKTLATWIENNLINDEYDVVDDSNIMLFRSVLDPEVKSTVGLNIHTLVGMILREDINKSEIMIKEIAKEMEYTLDYFLPYFALMPVRLFAVSSYTMKFFVRNSSSFIQAVSSTKFKANIKLHFAPLFSLVQIILGLTDDKETFVAMIARSFGIFDQINEIDSQDQIIEFSFLHFITCLIFDRLCLSNDKRKMKLCTVLFSLANGPIPLSNIRSLLWSDLLSDSDFMSELFTHVSRSTNDGKTWIRLMNEREWHAFSPWFGIQNVLEVIAKWNPDSLIPFPEYEPPPGNLDLFSILSTQTFMAIEFHILANCTGKASHAACVQTIVNLIITYSKKCKRGILKEDYDSIKVDSLEELTTKMPVEFYEFMWTPIIYNSRCAKNLVTIIQGFGKCYIKALEEMNIGFVVPVQTYSSTNKRLAMLAKKRALDELKISMSHFDFRETDEEQKENCSICACETGLLQYPVYAYNSPMSDVIETNLQGKTKDVYATTRMFKLCTHPIHSCCLSWQEGFQCPVCRGRRNALIPIVNDFDTKLTEEQQDAVYACIVKGFGTVDFEYILRSFCAHIKISEIRFRVKPDFIDQQSFRILTRYLFMAIWHFFRLNSMEVFPVDDPLIILVMQLIVNDKPAEGYSKRVSSISRRVGDNQKLEFARRAALIEHFCLNNNFEEFKGFTDWDDILSASYMSVKYQMNIEETTLPAYVLLKLPLDFIDLAREPYNLNIIDQIHETGLCLLTGKVVKFSSKCDVDIPLYKEHVKRALGNTFSPILMITGRMSSNVIIYSGVVKKQFDATTAYVDEYGESDIGLRRGVFLKLSSERVLHLVESILSGDWMDANADNFIPVAERGQQQQQVENPN